MIEPIRREDQDREIIRVNGLKVQRLRGGFLACDKRGIRRATEPNEPGNGKVLEQEDLGEEKGEHGNAPGEGVEFLYCKKCGTLIQVSPPGRSARCCGQMMTPLREVSRDA